MLLLLEQREVAAGLGGSSLAIPHPSLQPCVLTRSLHPVPLFPWITREGRERCGVDKGGIVQAPCPPQLQPCGSSLEGCVGLDGT